MNTKEEREEAADFLEEMRDVNAECGTEEDNLGHRMRKRAIDALLHLNAMESATEYYIKHLEKVISENEENYTAGDELIDWNSFLKAIQGDVTALVGDLPRPPPEEENDNQG